MKLLKNIKYLIIPAIIIIILIFLLIYYKFSSPISTNASLDYITFNLPQSEQLHITFLGNSPLSDDRGTNENFASLLESKSNIKVTNLSVPNTYATSHNFTFRPDYAFDAFSLYWITAAFSTGNFDNYETAFEYLNPVSDCMKQVVKDIKNLDTSQTHLFALWYDASDYVAGRKLSNPENPTDIQTYFGVLNATIQLLKAVYPDIQIIVFSPSYAYSPDAKGVYKNSEKFQYNNGYLYDYVMGAYNVCMENSVSYIDTYYLTRNRKDLFEDYIHLNLQGKEIVADHFISVLENNLY